jgi:ligand-binding sensor domain-containing protein
MSIVLFLNGLPLPPSNSKLNVVYHLIPSLDKPQEQLYLTTQSGWYRYDVASQSIQPQPLPADKNQLLENINYWSPDEKGYWFSSMQGFGYYNVVQQQVLDLSALVFAASDQKSTGFIVKATATNYWVTMRRSGILVYNIKTGKDTVVFGNKQVADNTYGQAIKDLQKGKDGNIWFTCSNKLYKVNPTTYDYTIFTAPASKGKVAEIKQFPLRILFTASGRLLVGSELCIYEFKNNQLEIIYPASGFSNYAIEKISEDVAHNFWVQTDAGLFKTDSLFTIWEDMNQLPGWKESTTLTDLYTPLPAQILFATDNKIGVLNQSYLTKADRPLKVLISRIRYGQKEQFLVDEKKQQINCSYKDAIEIELSPVNFIGERDNHILYRLKGWDKDWKELTGTGLIRYEQLPPGEYEFVTVSRNVAGIEGMESSLYFTVTPPFYMTWWFIV